MILKRNHDVSDSNEDFKKMPHANKILLNDINDRITCALCKGYFIDATTIIECLHTFCRSCIVKYLETHKYCPICDVQVHKTKPLANIRPDKIIQDIVYKLVPRLYHDEMRRRREFYSARTEAKPSALEEKNEVTYEYILTSDENVCVALNYTGFSGSPRYLKCPAAVTIGHLEKLIIGKYDLSPSHRVTMFYNDDALNSHSSLMEIAYIYSWRRKGPLELTYRIYENRTKRLKLDAEESSSVPAISNNNNNWKEVQLRISENGEISVTGIQDDIKDAVDDLGIVIKGSSEDEDIQNVARAPEDEKMDVDEPCEIVMPKLHKKLSNGSKRNEITGVLKVAKVRIRKIKSPKSKEKKEKKAKRGRRKKNDEDGLDNQDKDSKKDVNKNLEESVKLVNSVSVEEAPMNPEDSNAKLNESSWNQQESSGNHIEFSGNQHEPSGNQVEPSGNQLEPSGNQLEPSGNQLEPSGNQLGSDGNRHNHSGNHHKPSGNQHKPSGNQHKPTETSLNDKEEICEEKETRFSNGEDKTKNLADAPKSKQLEISGNQEDTAKSSQTLINTNQRSDTEVAEKTEKVSESVEEKCRESTEEKTGVEDKSLKQGDNNKTLDNSECIVDKKTKDLPKSEEKNSDENDKNLHNDRNLPKEGSTNVTKDTGNIDKDVPKAGDSQQSTKKTTHNADHNPGESDDDSQVTNVQNPGGNQNHNVNKILNDGSKTFPNSTGNQTMLPGNQTNLPGNQSVKPDPAKKSITEMMEKVQTTAQIAALNCFPGIPNVFSEFKAPIACTKTVTASCTLTASTLSNSTADFRRTKHKIEEKADYEPSPKQPTILNHTLGLQNLSNNHPLKKHALSKPEVATNSPKPVKPTTSSPCYMPRTTVYSPVINVPKPQTSTQAKINDTATKKEKAPPATILNSKVSIKPKPSSAPMGYKTLRDPPKSWNPQIARPTLNRNDPKSPADLKNSRPPKFFKMRNNLPRYLGNPASGVKPMYQLHISPEKDKTTVANNPDQTPKTEIKKHSIVKIDPKTLKPISERAPETSNLCRTAETTDLKINTSSVSIFNPLKLQCSGSPKNDRKSPHSPKVVKGGTSTSPPGRKDRVNLNFTPPNPFIPNLTSPTMSPNQFLFPAPHPPFTSYDPRVMAAYQSFYSRLPFVSHLGINLDMARKSFEMAKTNLPPLPSLPSTSASSAPQPKNNVKKKDKNEKSLQNAVEKLTQNKIKEAKLDTSTTLIGKENSDTVDKKKTETQDSSKTVAEGPPASSVPVASAPETKQ